MGGGLTRQHSSSAFTCGKTPFSCSASSCASSCGASDDAKLPVHLDARLDEVIASCPTVQAELIEQPPSILDSDATCGVQVSTVGMPYEEAYHEEQHTNSTGDIKEVTGGTKTPTQHWSSAPTNGTFVLAPTVQIDESKLREQRGPGWEDDADDDSVHEFDEKASSNSLLPLKMIARSHHIPGWVRSRMLDFVNGTDFHTKKYMSPAWVKDSLAAPGNVAVMLRCDTPPQMLTCTRPLSLSLDHLDYDEVDHNDVVTQVKDHFSKMPFVNHMTIRLRKEHGVQKGVIAELHGVGEEHVHDVLHHVQSNHLNVLGGKSNLMQEVVVCASAETTFREQPRRLYVLRRRDWKDKKPSDQMRWLHHVVKEATHSQKASDGPWVWPVHRQEVCYAIMASFLVRSAENKEKASWLRLMLWAFRIVPPPGGPKLEEELNRHYGEAVAYIFAWANLYISALWVLVPFTVILNALNRDKKEDFNGDIGDIRMFWWYLLQLYTLLWSRSLVEAGRSRRRVFGNGGGKITPLQSLGLGVDPVNGMIKGMNLVRKASGLHPNKLAKQPGENGKLRVKRYDSAALRADRSEAVRREQKRRKADGTYSSSTCASSPTSCRSLTPLSSPVSCSVFSRLYSPEDTEAVVKLQARARGVNARRKFRRALMVAGRIGREKVLQKERRNPKYWKPKTIFGRHIRPYLAGSFLLICSLLFTLFAAALLTGCVWLNAWLTYHWGNCLDPEMDCKDPEKAHGGIDHMFKGEKAPKGWGVETGVNVGFAILFDVVLGAVAQLIATILVNLQNCELEYTRRFRTVMLGLTIEVLSKVGLFAVTAFLFVPQWFSYNEDDLKKPASEVCHNYYDYEWCVFRQGCDTAVDRECCNWTLMCIAQYLEPEKKRDVFKKALKGPFVVAPFIRILVTVIIPLVAGKLEEWTTLDARDIKLRKTHQDTYEYGLPSKKGITTSSPDEISAELRKHQRNRGCCRRFWATIARILALIFNKDGDSIGGLCYVGRGWPFGLPKIKIEEGEEIHKDQAYRMLTQSLHQVTLKEFEPIDELLEMKMNFIFVVFLCPVYPIGLIPTILSRLLQLRTKLAKLFVVRRRCWPEEARLLHESQESFAGFVSRFAVAWHSALSAITYNGQTKVEDYRYYIFIQWAAIWLTLEMLLYVLQTCLQRLYASKHGHVFRNFFGITSSQ